MGRFSRTLLAVVLWGAACLGKLRGQDTVRTIVWDRSMLAELGQLADTASIEHVRCLLGAVRGDTLYVLVAWEPPVVHATKVILAHGPCPALLTVAGWHHHLPRDLTLMGEDLGARPAWAYCDLSPLDRRLALQPNPLPIEVLHVNKEVSCAFVLVEGRYERMRDWPPVDAP